MTTARDVIAASDCVWHFCAQHKTICLAEADRMIAALEAAGKKVLDREPTEAIYRVLNYHKIPVTQYYAIFDAIEPRKEP